MGVETHTHLRLHNAANQLPLPEPADPELGFSLRRLLAADAIVTHFQPIFSVRQRSIIGVKPPGCIRRLTLFRPSGFLQRGGVGPRGIFSHTTRDAAGRSLQSAAREPISPHDKARSGTWTD